MARIDPRALEAACVTIPLYLKAEARTRSDVRAKMRTVISAYLDAIFPDGAPSDEDLQWLQAQRRECEDPFEASALFEERLRHNVWIDRLISLFSQHAQADRH